MLQRRALHLHKRALAVRMHHLQHKFRAIRSPQMKIVVVFTRKRTRGSLHPKKLLRNFRRFGFLNWFCYRGFAHRAQKFSGKMAKRP